MCHAKIVRNCNIEYDPLPVPPKGGRLSIPTCVGNRP